MDIWDVLTIGVAAYAVFFVVLMVVVVGFIIWVFRSVLRDNRRFDEQWNQRTGNRR